MDINNGKNTGKKHRPAWMRVLDIILRTAHISVAGILFGGFVFKVPFTGMHIWHGLTIATGLGLLALELGHSLNWPHQGRGIMGMFHVGIPSLAHLYPDVTVPLLWATMVLGTVGSHMPRSLRHWSLLYRRVVD